MEGGICKATDGEVVKTAGAEIKNKKEKRKVS